ncbi:acyl-CoA N-acyltransferase [Mycena capillaripes]|nr:acyl-CoA N-acyltransferase [Mycena capillaripes]
MLLSTPRVSKSGRISLSAPTAADDEAAAALRKDPITRRFLRFLPKDINAEDVQKQRAAWAADPTVMCANVHALHRERAPEYIGYVYLHHIDRVMGNSCQVGIAMRANRFGAGLAREAMYEVVRYAFEEMNIHRVILRTAVDNELVWRWLDRLDVRFEMIERGCWSDGEGGYSDARMYSILYPEWVGGCRARVEQSIDKPQLEIQARL